PEFKLLRIKEVAGEADLAEAGSGEESLVAEVVDGEERLRAGEVRIAGEGFAEKHGQQTCLPVEAMKYIGGENATGNFQRGAREDGEADVVIGVIALLIAIEAGASAFSAVELSVFNKVMSHRTRTNLFRAGPDANRYLTGAEGNGKRIDDFRGGGVGCVHVAGDDDSD